MGVYDAYLICIYTYLYVSNVCEMYHKINTN